MTFDAGFDAKSRESDPNDETGSQTSRGRAGHRGKIRDNARRARPIEPAGREDRASQATSNWHHCRSAEEASARSAAHPMPAPAARRRREGQGANPAAKPWRRQEPLEERALARPIEAHEARDSRRPANRRPTSGRPQWRVARPCPRIAWFSNLLWTQPWRPSSPSSAWKVESHPRLARWLAEAVQNQRSRRRATDLSPSRQDARTRTGTGQISRPIWFVPGRGEAVRTSGARRRDWESPLRAGEARFRRIREEPSRFR